MNLFKQVSVMCISHLKFLVSIVVLSTLSNNAIAQDTSLMVIRNSKGVPAEMKMAQLKSVLKGEKQRWGDGTKVVIALMKPNTPIGGNTCKKVYNMSANEVSKYWLGLVFQGKADAPAMFNSLNELEDFVSRTPGAIGVIGQTANNNKTITVEGKKYL
jgi:hypothetical protein